MARRSRWAGLTPAERREQRRALLVAAAFDLFGSGGEAAVTVRSVCRAAALNSRYFYESFADTDELLGAVYDDVVAELVVALTAAMADLPDDRARLRSGIRTGLSFSAADPRRGRILFTEARTNPVLAARRATTQQQLAESVLPDRTPGSASARMAERVGAAMYAGAMTEVSQRWLAGELGSDLDLVVDTAVRLLTPWGAGP